MSKEFFYVLEGKFIHKILINYSTWEIFFFFHLIAHLLMLASYTILILFYYCSITLLLSFVHCQSIISCQCDIVTDHSASNLMLFPFTSPFSKHSYKMPCHITHRHTHKNTCVYTHFINVFVYLLWYTLENDISVNNSQKNRRHISDIMLWN